MSLKRPERGEPEQRRTDGHRHRPPRHGLVFGEPAKQTEQQRNQQRAGDDAEQRQACDSGLWTGSARSTAVEALPSAMKTG